jgi:hypothetical protein
MIFYERYKDDFPFIFELPNRDNGEIYSWCYDIFGEESGEWQHELDFDYSDLYDYYSPTYMIEYFKFKNKSDAIIFKLRWVNNI